MSKHPPVEDWATDFDHRDPRWIEDPFPIWDELRGRCPVAHSDALRGRRLLRLALRGRARDRLRHGAFLLAPRDRARDQGPAAARAADHLRSARAHAGAQAAAARVRAAGDRAPRAAGRARCAANCWMRSATRKACDARGRLRAAHSGAPDRAHARRAGRRRRPVPPLDPPRARGRHQRRIGDPADAEGDERVLRAPRSSGAATSAATT